MYADEDLNALLDGELSSADAKSLRDALANDPVLAGRLEQLAMADSIVKSTYQEIDAEPLPQSIADLLQESEPAVEDENSNVLSFSRQFWPTRPLQIAAGLVVSVGLFFGTAPLRQTSPDLYAQATTVGPVNSQSPIGMILNERASAVSYPLRDKSVGEGEAVAIMPVLSFKSSMGDWCREFTVTTYVKSARALACKQDKTWQIVLASDEKITRQTNDYATASTVTSAEFDARVDKLIEGDPLSADLEAEMIKKHWFVGE